MENDGALIVTTPQELAISDVRKSIEFCRILKLPVLGVIENMSGFVCPNCQQRVDIFTRGGGERMAKSLNVPFLGSIPLDPILVSASDKGIPFLDHYKETETAQALRKALLPIMKLDQGKEEKKQEKMREIESYEGKGNGKVNIAIPLSENQLSLHFGHCNEFLIAEVDRTTGDLIRKKLVPSPPHEPDKLPSWLHKQGAEIIIAGGMGQRAQQLFKQRGLNVVVGAPSREPEAIIHKYIEGRLATGDNICDH